MVENIIAYEANTHWIYFYLHLSMIKKVLSISLFSRKHNLLNELELNKYLTWAINYAN